MNARAKMSSKGQVVVPKSVRDAHGWTSGVELEFVEQGNAVLMQPVENRDPDFPPITWDEFEKLRIKVDRFPTDEEIEQALLDEAARRFREKTRS